MAAESKSRKERTILLPNDVLENLNGFAIDFGGSAIKVVYLSNEDWIDGKCKKSESGRGEVRLVLFAREELDDCLEFLKQNCYIRRKSCQEEPLMYTCGIGGYQYGTKIQQSLNVRIQNDNEMDGFKLCIQYYINNFSLDEFCVKPYKEIEEGVLKEMKLMWSKIQSMFGDVTIDEDHGIKQGVEELMDREYNSQSNIKPYVMAMLGSAWACIRCGEDNRFMSCGFEAFAGRSFLGLGKLLTGAQTYEELMTLAEKGDNLNLDITMRDIEREAQQAKAGGAEGRAEGQQAKAEGPEKGTGHPEGQQAKAPGWAEEEKGTGQAEGQQAKAGGPERAEGGDGAEDKADDTDVYSRMTDVMPRPVFLWGKAFTEELKPGCHSAADLARTLLCTMCRHLVRMVLQALHVSRTKHAFLAGNFVSHPLTRRIVTEEFEYAKWGAVTYFDGIDGDYHLHILEFGGYFGAIGSFMNGPRKTEKRIKAQQKQTKSAS